MAKVSCKNWRSLCCLVGACQEDVVKLQQWSVSLSHSWKVFLPDDTVCFVAALGCLTHPAPRCKGNMYKTMLLLLITQ
jgi:hypothetical protein